MLAAGTHAFLRGGGARIGALFEAEEHILELVHPGIGEEQRRIAMRHERRAPQALVPLALKEAQEHFADLIPAQDFVFLPAYRRRPRFLSSPHLFLVLWCEQTHELWQDRKSTRLNSSHGYISYAVFCL